MSPHHGLSNGDVYTFVRRMFGSLSADGRLVSWEAYLKMTGIHNKIRHCFHYRSLLRRTNRVRVS